MRLQATGSTHSIGRFSRRLNLRLRTPGIRFPGAGIRVAPTKVDLRNIFDKPSDEEIEDVAQIDLDRRDTDFALQKLAASHKFSTGMTLIPPTTAASAALSVGTSTPVLPSSRASNAIASTPLTDRTAPVNANSPVTAKKR